VEIYKILYIKLDNCPIRNQSWTARIEIYGPTLDNDGTRRVKTNEVEILIKKVIL
jgi:hypothetical protein